MLCAMAKYFPASGAPGTYCSDADLFNAVSAPEAVDALLSAELQASLLRTGCKAVPGDVKHVFVTKAGPGPLRQPLSEALLNPETGLPVPPGPNHKRLQISSV